MNVKYNIFNQITPEIPKLYHYTSQAGLLGIINNKKLWFTNIHYMNDSTEYIYSLMKIKEVADRLYSEKGSSSISRIFPSITDIEPIFSFSLSSNGDLLSQWRGYCPSGGFSISFFDQENFAQISQMMQMNNLYIGKCIYDDEQIEQFIIEMIFEISPEEFLKGKKQSQKQKQGALWHGAQYSKIINNTLKYAPLFKHPAFREEEEWRIVANYAESRRILKAVRNVRAESVGATSMTLRWEPPKEYIPFEEQYDSLKFRPGKSFLIPYLEVPLSVDERSVNITDIVVGPTPHIELSVQSCKLLLKDYSASVQPSELPYRNW